MAVPGSLPEVDGVDVGADALPLGTAELAGVLAGAVSTGEVVAVGGAGGEAGVWSLWSTAAATAVTTTGGAGTTCGDSVAGTVVAV